MANRIEWIDETHFDHLSHDYGEWMGTWNGHSYDSIIQENIDWAVETVDLILEKWGNHPAVFAIEPVNEPWFHSDFRTLRNFYRTVRENMKTFNPDLLFVFHDSFKLDGLLWNTMFEDDDMDNVVMDTHLYMFFWPKLDLTSLYTEAYRIILT